MVHKKEELLPYYLKDQEVMERAFLDPDSHSTSTAALVSRIRFDFLNQCSYDLCVLSESNAHKSLSWSYSLGYTVIVIKIRMIVVFIEDLNGKY